MLNGFEKMHDRALGAFIGLAVGDALGVPLSGLQRDQTPKIISMKGGGIVTLLPGEVTSHTKLAMILATEIVNKKSLDGIMVMRSFSEWSGSGMCTDISIPVLESIQAFKHSGRIDHPNITAADSGSLTRVAPVAIAFRSSALDCATNAKRQSDLTHGHFIPAELCSHLAVGLRNAIYGVGKDRTLAGFDALSVKVGKWRDLDRDKVKSTPLAIDAIKAALWSVDSSNNFEEALIMAVNLAGDSSTVGAITGQLAGAIFGYSNIPARWIRPLMVHNSIVELTERLFGMRE